MADQAKMKQRRVLALFFLATVALGLTACGVKRADVVGTYDGQFVGGAEVLTLSPDGKFVQDVVIQVTTQRYAFQGGWMFDASDQEVVLDNNFRIVLDRDRITTNFWLPQTGIVVLPAERLFRSITLGQSEGILYRKRPSK